MRALILEQPGRLRAATIAPPSTGVPPGMARVNVRRVGVCGTDFHAWRGRQPFFTYPRILGHELGVVVAVVGEGVTHVTPGDRCAVEPYLFCGRCDACRRGRGNCCERLKVLGVHIDGGMCEHLIVPADRLHPSAALDLDRLALTETLSIGAHAVRRGAIAPGETVLVVGAGPIGLSAAAFAQLSGARVVIADVSESRLRFAREWLGVKGLSAADLDAPPGGASDPAGPGVRGAGASTRADSEVPCGSGPSPATDSEYPRGARASAPANEQLQTALRACFSGHLPVVVIEATGNAASMERSFSLVAHGGRLVFVGLVQADLSFHDPELHRRELTVLASRNAQAEDFARVLQALEAGTIDVRPWVTHRAALTEVPGVFESWTRGETGVVKAIIELD